MFGEEDLGEGDGLDEEEWDEDMEDELEEFIIAEDGEGKEEKKKKKEEEEKKKKKKEEEEGKEEEKKE